jgi:hypothetical protein
MVNVATPFTIGMFCGVPVAPLMNAAVIDPSAIASTSLVLKSSATGQKTMSTAATTSSTCSARSTTVSSQPPHEAHQ